MKRIVRLRIDHLRLDRHAAGLAATLPAELAEALRRSLIARDCGASADWPATTRPALRQAADHLAAQLPLPGREGGE
jgi:hypothetical protein